MKTNQKIQNINSLLFGVVGFMLIAPLSVLFAAAFLIGMATFPLYSNLLPAGLLGDNLPGATGADDENTLLAKIKKQLEEAISGYEKTRKDSIKDSVEYKALTDKIAALESQAKNLKENADFATLVKELGALGVTVKALKESGLPTEERGFKNISEALTHAITEKKSELEAALKGDRNTPIHIALKVVGPISVTSTIAAGSTQNTITENTGIISTIRKRELTYLAYVSVGTIGTNRAVWVEETDEEGTPIMIAEGASKTQLDVQYVEQTMTVKKIGVYAKITTELMADIPQLVSFIEANLMKRLDIVLETQYFTGSGVGDNLKGLDQYATAFTGGALAGQVEDANELDVIEAIALQSKVAFGRPNVLFVHPSTMSKIKLIKDETGRPVWKDYITIDGSMKISGMTIVETTAITAGNFIGGDLSVVRVLIRENIGIQIGLDGNDFTKNLKTILLEKRVVQFVSGNDTGVIIDGDFASAIVLIAAGGI